MAATEKQWYVGEDGSLSVGEPAVGVTYHCALNAIIVSTKNPSLKVIDVTTGSLLQHSKLSGQKNEVIRCVYLADRDKMVFRDGRAVAARKDLNGVLLLDTALQVPSARTEDLVRVELPLAEASHLFKSLVNAELPGVDYIEDVLKELEKGIEAVQEATKGSHKTAKWATVCLEVPHCALKTVCTNLVMEMKRMHVNSRGMSIASSISDRLGYLLANNTADLGPGPVERTLMYSEAARRETFAKWPHMDYKWALPDPMAQAGFYHQPNATGEDRAMCFTCNVCLVCWEPTDEPWSEHERHSPSCPFVKGEHTQNVPLSVTYATQPAVLHGKLSDKIECMSESSGCNYIATSTMHGNIVVWSVHTMLKKYCQFNLDPSETMVAVKTGLQRDDVRECSTISVKQMDGEKDGTTTSTKPSAGAEAHSDKTIGCESSEDELISDGSCNGDTNDIVEIPLDDESIVLDERRKNRSRPSQDVNLSALCVLEHTESGSVIGSCANTNPYSEATQPFVVCGVCLRRTRQHASSNEDVCNEVRLMNEVNEAVSGGDLTPVILPDSEEVTDVGLEASLSFVPYLLVVGVAEETIDHPDATQSVSLSIPELSSVPTSHSWGPMDMMFEQDPDVQIVGVVPGKMQIMGNSLDIPKVAINNIDDPMGFVNMKDVTENTGIISNTTTPLVRNGTVLQCLELPVEFQSDYYYVSSITPTLDNQHIVVIVSPKSLQFNDGEHSVINEQNVMNSHQNRTSCDTDGTHCDRVVQHREGVINGENITCVMDNCDYYSNGKWTNEYCTVSNVNSAQNESMLPGKGGCVLVYKINSSAEGIQLLEEPCISKQIDSIRDSITSLLLLPLEISDRIDDEEQVSRNNVSSHAGSANGPKCEPTGQIAVTQQSGLVQILNLADLRTLANVEPESGDKYVSLTYCTGMERLCACSAQGRLHFYQLCDQHPDYQEPDPTDWAPVKEGASQESDVCDSPKTNDSDDTPIRSASGGDMIVKQPLTTDNMMMLHNLIQFENLMPRFTATVPPCWTEVQQEQQQRRHPQHLQHQGEATQHTRTWKLQPDGSTWDEHLIELVLPRPCSVGHVDVRFSLHPMCTSTPNIQITLLKQDISNIGKHTTGHGPAPTTEVDKKVNFNLPRREGALASTSGASSKNSKNDVNNVLDPLFLESHNAEVLCGPVNLSSCLDLSGNSGLISLTSPQLLNSKPRSFLLHVKGFVNHNGDVGDKPKDSKKKASTPASSTGNNKEMAKTIRNFFENIPSGASATVRLAATAPRQKLDNVKGCDWIQELTVTIRKSRRTNVARERLQRRDMLENTGFHEKLLVAASCRDDRSLLTTSQDHRQNMALDILCWITSIQMNDPNKRAGNRCILTCIQQYIRSLVKACFISGTRTTAHKCARLLTLYMEHCKLYSDPGLAPTFSTLLNALLDCLPLISHAYSSGALTWYFTLLNRVKSMDVTRVAERCTNLVTTIAKHYQDRASASHALLKARYGFYGQPFDCELFDMEAPHSLKQISPSPATTYASVIKNNNNIPPPPSWGQEELDFYDVIIPPTDKLNCKPQTEYARNGILGLLEVEPLHFSCHSTSDGTKMERMDIGVAGPPVLTAGTSGLSGTINFGELPPPPPVDHPHHITNKQINKIQQFTHNKVREQIQKMFGDSAKIVSMKNANNAFELMPPTPKTTPLFMTPPVTPPNESLMNQLSQIPDVFSVDEEPGPSTLKASVSKVLTSIGKHDAGKQPKTAMLIPQAQNLLQPPPPQVLVIERMHTGARRFVTLDFGKPILLTDVIIPACGDLASVSIDVWVQGEEVDGQRLVVASDIGIRTLVMNNIMPPPICRYLKITTVGRYGGSTTRSRIPIGSFYGHSYILPWEWNGYVQHTSKPTANQMTIADQPQLLSQLSMFLSLLEDIQCRYSLARTRLEQLLAAVELGSGAAVHTQYFLRKQKKPDEDNRIVQAYNDCLQLQLQQNLAQRAIDRLQRALGLRSAGPLPETDGNLSVALKQTSTDTLRFLLECLLDMILAMTQPSPSIPQVPVTLYTSLTPLTCESLFKHLCISGSRKIQIAMGMVLVRVCGSQPWWGEFLGNILQEFFNSDYSQVFPQDRVFVLLTALGQKSLLGPSAVNILESLLTMLARVLSPLMPTRQASSRHQSGLLDLSLVGWLLLFLCRNLDSTMTSLASDDSEKGAGARKDRDPGLSVTNRWNFIQGDSSSNLGKSKDKRSVKLYRRSVQRRLYYQKKFLVDVEMAKMKFMNQMGKTANTASKETQNLLKLQEHQLKKEFSQYTSKHLKDIMHIRRTDGETLRKLSKEDGSSSTKDTEPEYDGPDNAVILPKDKCLSVVHGLVALILSMDSTCNVDLFLIACKVLARICLATRPAITMAEAMTQAQLEQLLLLCANLEYNHGNIMWGGPWASHAVTCLLQDLLEGERLYPATATMDGLTDDDISGTITDDSLPNSVNLTATEVESPDDAEGSEGSQSKDDLCKVTFDKESSLMVDLLLDEDEFDDETTTKFHHEYVTGDTAKPSSGENLYQIMYVQPTSDTEEYTTPMDAADDKKQKLKHFKSKLSDYANSSKTTSGTQGISFAMDSRLEFGLDTQPELRLRVMQSLQSQSIQNAFIAPIPDANQPDPSWSNITESNYDMMEATRQFFNQQSQSITSSGMLSQCYDHMFTSLIRQVNLDVLLQLWLTLNDDGSREDGNQMSFNPNRMPLIPLSSDSVLSLLNVLSLTPNLSIHTWVLVFQSLTLLMNQQVSIVGDSEMVQVILTNNCLSAVLLKFLCGVSNDGPTASGIQSTQVGPSATKTFYLFLQRLQRKAVKDLDLFQYLKDLMLKLIYTMTSDRGGFYSGIGPLDAQCKFLDFVLDMTYEKVDRNNAINIIESISSLVHQHILCQERVSCRSSLENNTGARTCFGGLFASLIRGGDSRSATGEMSKDILVCNLMKLVNMLVKIQIASPFRGPSSHVDVDNDAAMSLSEPVTDSTKLSQVLATSTPTTVRSVQTNMNQTVLQTDEQKTESGIRNMGSMTDTRASASSEASAVHLADMILGHQQIMFNLINALSYCNSSSMAMILGCSGIAGSMQNTFAGGDAVSVGDEIYQILVTLSKKSSEEKLLLESLFQYLSGQGSSRIPGSLCRLSEPLLWFVLKVLDSSRSLQLFLNMGGIEVVCNNLVNSNRRIVSTGPSLISTIMQNLSNGKSPTASAKSDTDTSDGLQNFAPLGSISSSSPTSNSANVLIQASPPHRRARTAAWSYHFYPGDAWVDLTIQLPFAILLKEIQIQPHSSSLSTCPAYVSVELSHDGLNMSPMCPPLLTSSLAFIKLTLQKAEVATAVTIRLHRARDSMTIGLSQILLMGYSAFGDSGTRIPNVLLPTEDNVSRTSMGWMRLLHHCLTAHDDMQDLVAAAAAPTPNLLNTCTALLVTSAVSTFAPDIDTVLLKLGLHSAEMGLALVDNMLRSTSSLNVTGEYPYLGKISGVANESTIEILYKLGLVQDAATPARVEALLQWLSDCAQMAVQQNAIFSHDNYVSSMHLRSSLTQPNPAPAHVHCIAAILWQSQDIPVGYDLAAIISRGLVWSLYEWSFVLPSGSPLKRAVDCVLCSACYIHPDYFALLLEWLGIVIDLDTSMTASISDDQKDCTQYIHESLTDDSKEANAGQPETPPIRLQEFNHMILDECHLSTLAIVCKSPGSLHQLLESGFPAVLSQMLYEFCNLEIAHSLQASVVETEPLTDANKSRNLNSTVPKREDLAQSVQQPPEEDLPQSRDNASGGNDTSLSVTSGLVASVLNFFAELSQEARMRDWLGGAEGNIFWSVLLAMLCNMSSQSTGIGAEKAQNPKVLQADDRAAIETATVQFFTQVISCHQANQHLFAQVLCNVIRSQGTEKSGPVVTSSPLSGFTRRLFLQVLLEDEKILVSFQASEQQRKIEVTNANSRIQHPRFGTGRRYRTLVVSLQTTVGDLLSRVSDMTIQLLSDQDDKKSDDSKKKDARELGIETVEYLANAAGLLAKEKRDKSPSKSALPPRPPTRRGRHTAESTNNSLEFPILALYHPNIPNKALPHDLSLSQLLKILHQQGLPQGQASLEFFLKIQPKKTPSSAAVSTSLSQATEGWPSPDIEAVASENQFLPVASFPSAMQVFASVGGLALLAEHLPLLYPEISRQSGPSESSGETSTSGDLSQEWVAVESSEEFYEPIYDQMVPPAPLSSSRSPRATSGGAPTIPPHSLMAFGLFLRLPGYAEVLLEERQKAQCLLRLVLGVTDDGDGGHILTSPIASSLPTLPFQVLKTLFDATPLTTDDGVLLRRMTLEIGALHLILACLSVLSHHAPRINQAGFQQETQIMLSALQTNGVAVPGVTATTTATEEKPQSYWAKGTGFGTGSTTSSWDAKQALLRQKSEEEHVTCLLLVLASYIGAQIPKDFESPTYSSVSERTLLPDVVPDLLNQSCLIPTVSSNLRNDSVLDMARHVPLYRALLELLRSLAVCPNLVPLLLPLDKPASGESCISVGILLDKMRRCVDTYASRLKSNNTKTKGSHEEEEENEGLALLIPDIQDTARIVQIASDRVKGQEDSDDDESEAFPGGADSSRRNVSVDEKYMTVMKPLQFDTFEMVTGEGNTLKFFGSHHYESNVKAAGDLNNAARARRLAQEAVTLSTSLPLSASSSVFVRCDEERLDVMKVLITGPSDTPYVNGCFEFDVYFPQYYPNSPPYINLETTGNHSVRFNPNLYNDGKVCLSVLNTWHGRPEEKWNPHTSSFLQVLVSIQSLILVSEPYFNEPGYERSRGTPSGTASSREYDANIRQATVKWAMLEQIRNPSACFKEVIHKHFWLKRHEILRQCEIWISELERFSNDKRTGRTIAHSTLALKRHYNQLREEFAKMKPPSDLEDFDHRVIDAHSTRYVTEQSPGPSNSPAGSASHSGGSTLAKSNKMGIAFQTASKPMVNLEMSEEFGVTINTSTQFIGNGDISSPSSPDPPSIISDNSGLSLSNGMSPSYDISSGHPSFLDNIASSLLHHAVSNILPTNDVIPQESSNFSILSQLGTNETSNFVVENATTSVPNASGFSTSEIKCNNVHETELSNEVEQTDVIHDAHHKTVSTVAPSTGAVPEFNAEELDDLSHPTHDAIEC